MPTLTNLTQKQKQLCDLIWSCETQEDLAQLIRALPRRYRQEAAALYQLILAECIDEEITEEYHCEQAQELLQKYHS